MHKKRLDSWKAIAEFLGRSLRTVQRWHEFSGLPVHHFGGRKGSVFAYEEEIEDWLTSFAENSRNVPVQAHEQLETAKRTSRELTTTADNMWETRSVNNIQTIANLYHKAIDNDSCNAAAFAGLANAMIFCALNDIMDGAIAFPSAVEALRRIPPLESDYVDAKCPAAWLDLLYRRNWRQARASFEELVRKRPTSSFARSGLAAAHVADGRLQDALECAWEAWRLNPLVRSLAGCLCWIAYLSGDFRRVLELVAQIRMGGGDGRVLTTVEALVLIQNGDLIAHVAQLEKAAQDSPQNQLLQGILGYVYGILGEESKARDRYAQLAHSSETNRKSNGYALALVSLGLEEREGAVSWLEAAFAEGSFWSLGFRSDPILRCLDGEPRFERLVSKIGAPGPSHVAADFRVPVTQAFLQGALAGENP